MPLDAGTCTVFSPAPPRSTALQVAFDPPIHFQFYRKTTRLHLEMKYFSVRSAVVGAALALASGVASATEVSVCRDAIYDLPSARGAVCAGAGATPAGLACPIKGDQATKDCHPYLPSFDGKHCVAKEDAQCQVVAGSTWGCVFPSTGCGNVPTSTPCSLTLIPVEATDGQQESSSSEPCPTLSSPTTTPCPLTSKPDTTDAVSSPSGQEAEDDSTPCPKLQGPTDAPTGASPVGTATPVPVSSPPDVQAPSTEAPATPVSTAVVPAAVSGSHDLAGEEEQAQSQVGTSTPTPCTTTPNQTSVSTVNQVDVSSSQSSEPSEDDMTGAPSDDLTGSQAYSEIDAPAYEEADASANGQIDARAE